MGKPQKRIVVAVIFGVLIVISAYFLRTQKTVDEAETLTDTIERKYIKPTDEDHNGVPDWQDALLVEDTITLGTTSTSTYQKPITVTGRFGVSFFENLLRSKMYGAFGDTPEELASTSVARLKQEVVDELFTEEQITLFETTDTTVLKVYGNQIATILTSQKTESESELVLIQEYVRYEDTAKLLGLEKIALSYTTIVKDLLAVSVPSTYAKQHLDLTNAVNAVREDVRAMHAIESDPLYTLLRTKRYEDDVLGMQNAIKNLFNTLYLQDGIRWQQGEPVTELMVFPQ